MSEWSKSAAHKFAEKQAREKLASQILKSQASQQWESLRESFTEQVMDFNTASGNVILDVHSFDSDDSFRITRKNSERVLLLSFDSSTNQITASGSGGLSFDEKITIAAEIHTKTAFLQDGKKHPLDEDEFIVRSLDVLLEI